VIQLACAGVVQMRQCVVADQVWRFGLKANSGHRAVADAHIESMVVSGVVPSTWPTAVAIGPPLETISTLPPWFLANVVECADDAVLELAVARHAVGAEHAVHPLRQAVAQQAKVLAVALGRVGFFEAVRLNWQAITASLSYSFNPPGQRLHLELCAFTIAA